MWWKEAKEIFKKEKGVALIIAILFVLVFLFITAALFGLYMSEVKAYQRVLKRYQSSLMVRDSVAVISALQTYSLLQAEAGFVQTLADDEVNNPLVMKTDQYLDKYPLPSSYQQYFPQGVLYVYAYLDNNTDTPYVDSLAVVEGPNYSVSKLYTLVEQEAMEEGFPLAGKLTDRKTMVSYGVYDQNLSKLGNAADITNDYGPYARLSGVIIFRRKGLDLSNPITFWGIPKSGWEVYRNGSLKVGPGRAYRIMDTLINGEFYFGGDDIRVCYDDNYYLYTTSKDKYLRVGTMEYGDHFAVISDREYPSPPSTAGVYYYDSAKARYKTVTLSTDFTPYIQSIYDIYYKIVFRGSLEVKSQKAHDIISYLFDYGSPEEGAPEDPWERVVSSSSWRKSAYYRAFHENKVYEISESGSYYVTFYVDSDKHTHMIYRKTWESLDDAIDVDLTHLYGDKVFVYFSGYGTDVYIVPPCGVEKRGGYLRKIWSNSICKVVRVPVTRDVALQVNDDVNPQATDQSLNPNWKYEWTHYVYPWSPDDFNWYWHVKRSKPLAKPYHANWQNMNIYSMKITLAVNGNVYVKSSIIFLPDSTRPESVRWFEYDHATSNEDILLDKDIPGATKYPQGEVMAIYSRDDILFYAYDPDCGNKRLLMCRAGTMYGYRFARDSKNKIAESMINYDGPNYELHSWDMLFYSHAISIEGSWHLARDDGYFPYSSENFKKLGTLAQGGNSGGMICSRCEEGYQGFMGNRYYIVASNAITNSPAYWLMPPDRYIDVTIKKYREGH